VPDCDAEIPAAGSPCCGLKGIEKFQTEVCPRRSKKSGATYCVSQDSVPIWRAAAARAGCSALGSFESSSPAAGLRLLDKLWTHATPMFTGHGGVCGCRDNIRRAYGPPTPLTRGRHRWQLETERGAALAPSCLASTGPERLGDPPWGKTTPRDPSLPADGHAQRQAGNAPSNGSATPQAVQRRAERREALRSLRQGPRGRACRR